MDTLRILKELSALIRNEMNWGENTAERVGRTLVGIVEQLVVMEPSSSNQFTDLDGIPESEFDNITQQGYYLYAVQAGTGDIKGILVVSNDGDIRQIRYEFGGTYTRSRTDEGWEEWTDQFIF